MDLSLPVAVIGGGPIGLAAAAHLMARGVPVRLFEAGSTIAPNMARWGHVRLFSVWDQCVDAAATALLERNGWKRPSGGNLPTGGDLVEHYLQPLADIPAMASIIETGSEVIRITRQGLDRMASKDRSKRPFALTLRNAAGTRRTFLARAVVDTSGTWQNPNPLGSDGWPAPGEEAARQQTAYGIPDISGAQRLLYAGQRVLVVGGGHSAANALLDLAVLSEQVPRTTMTWAVRGTSLTKIFGGGAADQLPARGKLGARLRMLVDAGRLTITTGFTTERVASGADGVLVLGRSQGEARTLGPFDRIVVATGQRPDFTFARELQLDLHPVVESSRALGPLIDPNEHSCGTVPPHGWRELAHREPDYFVAGIKSYGRAPTFLLLTGYEQVRSIAAHLAGDQAAADEVRLVLPETGVCNASLEEVAPGGLCCDGAAPRATDPCCVRPVAVQAIACCSKPAMRPDEPARRPAELADA